MWRFWPKLVLLWAAGWIRWPIKVPPSLNHPVNQCSGKTCYLLQSCVREGWAHPSSPLLSSLHRSRPCMITQPLTVTSCNWRLGMWCLWFHLRTLRSRWVGKTGCEPGLGGAKRTSRAASSSTNSWLAGCRAISLWLGTGERASCPWAWGWLPATEKDSACVWKVEKLPLIKHVN